MTFHAAVGCKADFRCRRVPVRNYVSSDRHNHAVPVAGQCSLL